MNEVSMAAFAPRFTNLAFSRSAIKFLILGGISFSRSSWSPNETFTSRERADWWNVKLGYSDIHELSF